MFRTTLLIIAITALSVASFAQKESDVAVYNPKAKITLAGTLSEPEAKPKAVLVMLTGSGAQNRDEEIFGHKPFKVLADELAKAGYASLRMDDRGYGTSEGDITKATLDDFLSDANTAIAFADSVLKDVPIGILGHSEGGLNAIRLGADNEDVNFIITLAAPAWPGDSIIMSQARAIATAAMGSWPQEQLERDLLNIAKSPVPTPMARMSLMARMGKEFGGSLPPAIAENIAAQVEGLISPSYRSFLRFDPSGKIAALKKPWLAMNGDKDFQVLPGNLETIRQLNPSATTVLLERHNHLFQECSTGMIDEYSRQVPTPSETAVTTILNWLNKMF